MRCFGRESRLHERRCARAHTGAVSGRVLNPRKYFRAPGLLAILGRFCSGRGNQRVKNCCLLSVGVPFFRSRSDLRVQP